MKRKIIAATMATAMLLSMAAPTAYAEDIVVGATAVEGAANAEISSNTYNAVGIKIAEKFPDAEFQKYVSEKFDSDGDGYLNDTEILKATSIELYDTNNNSGITTVTSLKGIEYLTALTNLQCDNNKITSLDLSKNTALVSLSCSDNQLTSLNISNNKNLMFLACVGNQLTALELSNQSNLSDLYCSHNKLTALDLSKNTALMALSCSDNQLAAIDVSNSKNLLVLQCPNNNLDSLDVSGNTALSSLVCSNNQLAALDVSNNTALEYLECDNNCLPVLNLENVKKLDMEHSAYSPQTIKGVETADVAALVGQANIDRVSDTKTLTNGIEYCYDVKSTDANGAALPKMKVTVEVAAATATPVPQTSAKPDQPQATATPAPTTPGTSPEPTDKPNVEPSAQPTPGPTTPANPDDNTGTGDNDGNTNNGTGATPEPPNTEGTTGFVDRLYSVCLGRPADAAGQADWVKQLTSYQISGTKAAYGFIFSEEFTNKNYSNADYVEHLYEAFMGRASDEGGKADWVGKLDAGTTREEVFNGFANSVEFDNICKSYGIVSKDIETFVTRLYSVCLDRQPDDAGLADWANQLRSQTISGKAAASGFVFSEEFTSKNYSNADYVEHLYAAFMGRASDEGGKADWVSKLDAGTTREAVFNGFADSAEFNNICASYGIARG